jgi:replication factor A2
MQAGGGYSQNQSPNAGTGFTSPGGEGGDGDGQKSRYGNKDEQTIVPVTVRMVLGSQTQQTPGGGYATHSLPDPDGRPLNLVKLVAAVRETSHKSSFYIWVVEDGTGGTLEARKHHTNDGASPTGVDGGVPVEEQIQDGMYVHVVGQINEYDGRRFVQALSIRPISSGNEVTHHMLEVVYSHERHLKQLQGGGANAGATNPIYQPLPKQQGQALQQQGGMGGGGGESNPGHSRVFQAMQEIESAGDYGEVGWPKEMLIEKMQAEGVPESVVIAALSEAANDGVIYSTTDDNHYTFTG